MRRTASDVSLMKESATLLQRFWQCIKHLADDATTMKTSVTLMEQKFKRAQFPFLLCYSNGDICYPVATRPSQPEPKTRTEVTTMKVSAPVLQLESLFFIEYFRLNVSMMKESPTVLQAVLLRHAPCCIESKL
jgi:hypothetical protein